MYGNRSAAWMMLKAYNKCVEDCQTALTLDPKFTKIRQRLIKGLIALGEFLKAKINIKTLLESNPEDKDATNDLNLVEKLQNQLGEADAALEAKDYAKAQSLYIQIEQHAAGSDTILLKETQANLGLRNYAQVLRDCLQIIRHDPSNADAYFYRAKALYYTENYDQAVSHLQECLRLNPDHSGASREFKKVRQVVKFKKAAEEAVFVRNFTEAIQHYTDALEADKENSLLNAKLYASRAEAKYRLPDMEGALEDCKKALELDRDFSAPYLTRANIYMQTEKYEEAVAAYEYILKHIDANSTQAAQRLQDAQFNLRKQRRRNYYELLGVMTVASTMEIRDAYKQKAMEWHPDKHSNKTEEERKKAEQMFKDIQEGYEILTDPFKKDLYDKGYDLEAINEQVQMKEMREKRRQQHEGYGHGHGHSHGHDHSHSHGGGCGGHGH
jgi:DnaJ family protein C protein 7